MQSERDAHIPDGVDPCRWKLDITLIDTPYEQAVTVREIIGDLLHRAPIDATWEFRRADDREDRTARRILEHLGIL